LKHQALLIVGEFRPRWSGNVRRFLAFQRERKDNVTAHVCSLLDAAVVRKDHHREQHFGAINNSIETLKLLMSQFLTYKSGQVSSGHKRTSRLQSGSSNSPEDIRVVPLKSDMTRPEPCIQRKDRIVETSC
jgi:hypothetical protein